MGTGGRWAVRTSLALLVGAVLVGGCGSGGSTSSPADQAYLQALHLAQPDIGTYRSDVQLTRLGHAVCDGFAGGATFQSLADRLTTLQGSHALPSEDLGSVIDAAVNTLCPQYRSRTS